MLINDENFIFSFHSHQRSQFGKIVFYLPRHWQVQVPLSHSHNNLEQSHSSHLRLKLKSSYLLKQVHPLKAPNHQSDPNGESEPTSIFDTSRKTALVSRYSTRQGHGKVELKERQIPELGDGLALPSLVLQYRSTDITASDYHR